jgi:hypothetical protein
MISATPSPPKERKSMMIWFVAYSLPSRRKSGGERLEQFADEAAAKEFAKKKAKMRIRAGTLPGIIPSKQIGPTKIQEWLKSGANDR